MQTTLNKIKSHSPCEDGWKKLLNYLGKTEADDEPLELRTILESNGLDDTLWVLRAVDGKDKEIRLFAADCAELVLPIYEKQYPNDDRPRKAIQAARDYANGVIGKKELTNVWHGARASQWAAEKAAKTAAIGYGWASTNDAWNVRLAKWSAEKAARDAKSAAKWAAEFAAERAAMAAAIGAAWNSPDSGWAARDAAKDARDEIKSLLLKYI